MTEPKKHNGETHTCCSARLEEEVGQARCCYCVPHEGCEFTAPTTPPTGNYFQYRADPNEKKLEFDAPPTEGWKEKLDDFAIINGLYLRGVNVTKLSAFIESLLAEQKTRMVEPFKNLNLRHDGYRAYVTIDGEEHCITEWKHNEYGEIAEQVFDVIIKALSK